MSLQSAIAHNVRTYRRQAGLSQEELAFRSGLHRTYISRIEQGANITVRNIERVAAALDVSPMLLILQPPVVLEEESAEKPDATLLCAPDVVLPPNYQEGEWALCHWDKTGLRLTPAKVRNPDLTIQVLVALAMQGHLADLAECYETVQDNVLEAFHEIQSE